MTITLPWPPTANTYYRNLQGRTLISEAGRKYRTAVAEQILVQRAAKHLMGRITVQMTAHVPDKRRRDLDNLLKPMLDALTHAGVWGDDSQIDKLLVERGPVGGFVRVTITEG